MILVIPRLSENNSDCWLLGRSKISAAEEHSASGRGIARSMVQTKCEAQDKDSLHYRPIYQHKGDDMEACWGRNECCSAEHVSWRSCIPSEGHWSGERVQCSIKRQCDCNHAWYQGKLDLSVVEFLYYRMGEMISCWGIALDYLGTYHSMLSWRMSTYLVLSILQRRKETVLSNIFLDELQAVIQLLPWFLNLLRLMKRAIWIPGKILRYVVWG